ncbi:MAG: hypothetical protein ACHQVS_01380 [Candidatus Babeliales bacterium]
MKKLKQNKKKQKDNKNRLNQFVIEARNAYQNGSFEGLQALNSIYNDARAILPQLNLIPEEYRQGTLTSIRGMRDGLEKILKGGKEGKQAQVQVLSPAEAQQELNDIINTLREAWFSNDEKTKQAAVNDAVKRMMELAKQPNITQEQIKKGLSDIEEFMKPPQIETGTTPAYAPAGTLTPGAGAGQPITKQGAQPGYAAISGTEKAKKQFAALEVAFLTALETADVSQMKSTYNQMIALLPSIGYTAADQESLKTDYQKLINAATIIENRSNQFFKLLQTKKPSENIVKLEAFYAVTRNFVEGKVKDISPSLQYMKSIDDSINGLLENMRKTIDARKEEAQLKSKSSFPLD